MKEFIEIKRREPQYRQNRTRDFLNVEVRASEKEIVEQSKRCMSCGIPFCHGYGCPLSNNIPEMNSAISESRFEDAYKILSTTSPFPEFTSRICPALCESACCANLPSSAVTIKQIEFFTIEKAFTNSYVKALRNPYSSGKRIAVIGSGPSGLSTAHYLNKFGHEVVVFEKLASAGGLLRYGIPDFKLGKHIVERRIDLMRQSGIFFEFGVEIGKDISIDYLTKKFDAICLCIGCETPRDLPIKGRQLNNIHFALDFLRSQNRVISGEKLSLDISAKNKRVLIIGGGDTGSDCMGTSFRQGAKEVTQIEIMPEPPLERDSSTPWPQWEYKKRTSSSHLEGGTRMWSIASDEFIGENGDVKSLKASEIKWSFDASGKPSKFEKTGRELEIKADLVLLSMGFTGIKNNSIIDELSIQLTKRNAIDCNENMQSSCKKIFACGDAISGPSLVVRAIASGKKAAYEIDKYLKNYLQ